MEPQEQETWESVPGWEGLYLVSSFGRVRSLARNTTSGRLLKPWTRSRTGYPIYTLSKNGQPTHLPAHEVVLMTFVGPRPDGLVACHGDGDKTNNRLSNLRWDTQSANQRDYWRLRRLAPRRRKQRPPGAKLVDEDVLAIRALVRTGRFALRHIARLFGVASTTVISIRDFKTWKHLRSHAVAAAAAQNTEAALGSVFGALANVEAACARAKTARAAQLIAQEELV
jgi:hypothetical protein